MPTGKSPLSLTPDSSESLSKSMADCRKEDARVASDYAGRAQQIDELEDEIISNYSNSADLKLSKIADPINCQQVMAAASNMLGRITEIYNESLRNKSKLSAIQGVLMDGLLPLMQGGSAESRMAQSRGCMNTITYLNELEQGLMTICESTQKTIKAMHESASRVLRAIEIEIQFFGGVDALQSIVELSRKKRYE